MVNLDFALEAEGDILVATDAMLLVGRKPRRFLAQSGIRAICYPGIEPDYATNADEIPEGPLVPLYDLDGSMIEPGLADRAWAFVRRKANPTARLEGAPRIDRWEFPEEVARAAVVNALVHRDYSIAGTDVAIEVFRDRLQIRSPGRLPNTVAAKGMVFGARYARNQTLVNVMRDYRYAEA